VTRNTLILSDAHLSAVLPDYESGMHHRKDACLFDEEIAALLDRAILRSGLADLEIVFNGDLFDFDAPPSSVHQTLIPDSISHEQTGAVSVLEKILDDHPVFVRACGRVVCAGKKLVFVSGNHDAQMVFPLVRKTLANRIVDAALLYGQHDPKVLWKRILFRSFCYATDHGLHIEHGHAYDPFCVLGVHLPFESNGSVLIERTVGSIASYYGPAILRDIYPYAANPLDVRAHDLVRSIWARMLSGEVHPQWMAAAVASFLSHLSKVDVSADPERMKLFCQKVAKECGLSEYSMVRQSQLFAQKSSAEQAIHEKSREEYGVLVDRAARDAMKAISDIHSSKAIVFGHTHVPWTGKHKRSLLGNSGSWSHKGGSHIWVESDPDGIAAFEVRTQ